MSYVACPKCGHDYSKFVHDQCPNCWPSLAHMNTWNPPELPTKPAPLPADDAKAVRIARLETLRDIYKTMRDLTFQRYNAAFDRVTEITLEIAELKSKD